MTASNLNASHDYLIRVAYTDNISATSDCPANDRATTSVDGRSSYSDTFIVYGCAVGSAMVTADLHRVINEVEQVPPTATSSTSIMVAPIPEIGVGLANVLTGQSVTMTVSSPASRSPVSSYQWQEWSGGQWTDLGSASTSTQRIVESDAAGVRTFRVKATYTSGAEADSYPVTVSWRPMVVAVAADPVDPESGESVTLTATADAPSDVTYQWQRWSEGVWANDGAASTSTKKAVSFSTRGTRKYRVVVSHVTATSTESLPVYVTWDEGAIVRDMIRDLSAAVATSTAYRASEQSLVTCLNGADTSTTTPRYTTFDGVLSDYTGEIKSGMEESGACASEAATMFDTVENLSRTELAVLKSGSTEYAALLETPHGERFEANVGTPYTVKLYASLVASDTTVEPGTLESPLYGRQDIGSRSSIVPPPRRFLLLVPASIACLQVWTGHSSP